MVQKANGAASERNATKWSILLCALNQVGQSGGINICENMYLVGNGDFIVVVKVLALRLPIAINNMIRVKMDYGE